MRGNILGYVGGAVLATLASTSPNPAPPPAHPVISSEQEASNRKLDVYIDTYVTGYNTVAAQTDDTPCIAASGANICGRHDAVACPPMLPFGTVVEINGKKYVCEDRMARKYRGRFDISCDKDKRCPYQVAGQTLVKVFLE